MRMRRFLLVGTIALCGGLVLCGCSTLSELLTGSAPGKSRESNSTPATQAVPVEQVKTPRRIALTSLELRWQSAEQHAPDGFIIYYGESVQELTKKVRILRSELESVTLPSGDKIYRYIMHDLPPDRSVWVAVASFRGGEESAPTAPYEVAAKNITIH